MKYRIARNGQVFGPYTEAEVLQYLASGNILLTDLAQAEGTANWVPVQELFPLADTPFRGTSAPPTGFGSSSAPGTSFVPGQGTLPLYPDPPDLPWWVVLLLAVGTGGVFIVIWDIVQAAWLRRVQPASSALALYIAIAVVYVLRLPSSWATIDYNIFGGPPVGPHHGFLLFLVWLGLYIASRTVIRGDLLRHFNGPEPIGLRLNAFLVYLFGGLYLQYHFNRINDVKRAMHVSVPA